MVGTHHGTSPFIIRYNEYASYNTWMACDDDTLRAICIQYPSPTINANNNMVQVNYNILNNKTIPYCSKYYPIQLNFLLTSPHINQVKKDALPLIRNPKESDIGGQRLSCRIGKNGKDRIIKPAIRMG